MDDVQQLAEARDDHLAQAKKRYDESLDALLVPHIRQCFEHQGGQQLNAVRMHYTLVQINPGWKGLVVLDDVIRALDFMVNVGELTMQNGHKPKYSKYSPVTQG
jgi:hypothetical protein